MEIIAGIILALVGLTICFRGIYIGKVFKAIFGAIQGAIYALTLSLILAILQVATESVLFMLVVLFALLLAYLAVKKEELYRKLQGFINAFMIGAGIGAFVYAAIMMNSYRNSFYGDGSSSNALALIAGLAIVVVFGVLGIRAYNIFRRIGTLVLTLAICILLLLMYMPIMPAIILGVILTSIVGYLLNLYQKYIDYLKISAIGAVICVAGILDIFGRSYLISSIPQMLFENIYRILSREDVLKYYNTETTMVTLGIVVLSIAGMLNQQSYVAAHTDADGKVVLDWSNFRNVKDKAGNAISAAASGVGTGIYGFFTGIADFFKRSKTSILKGLKILVLVAVGCGVLAGIVYGGQSLISYIKQRGEDNAVDSAATRYVKSINNLYGKDAISLSGAKYVGAEGDGFDATFTADISGELSGIITATGISDPDSGELYPDYIRVEIACNENMTENTAKMFASVITTFFNADEESCEKLILDTLLYGDFGMDYYMPWVEVDLGRAANATVQIALSDNNTIWTMTCGPKF